MRSTSSWIPQDDAETLAVPVGCTNSIVPAKTPIQPPRLTPPRAGRITPKNSEVDRGDPVGLNAKTVQAGRASERLSDASSTLSARVSRGRAVCRRRIASSCRRTRISNSFERRGRASSQTSANRFRTTRYTNDQSNSPSLDHSKSPERSGVRHSGGNRTSLRTLRARDTQGNSGARTFAFTVKKLKKKR
jgi:hypothetical protein